MKTFESIWQSLVTHLRPGLTIANWTAYRGNLGDNMTVAGLRNGYIEIEAPKAKTIQIVPKADFERVWEVWSDYKSQKMPRYEIRDMTQYSKYIISILHWYEDHVMDH
jgi:hypothetical protein